MLTTTFDAVLTLDKRAGCLAFRLRLQRGSNGSDKWFFEDVCDDEVLSSEWCLCFETALQCLKTRANAFSTYNSKIAKIENAGDWRVALDFMWENPSALLEL